MRYVVDFGMANTGGTPTVNSYVDGDTLAAVANPTLTEIGVTGQFWWPVDWTTVGATSIVYKFTLNGSEVAGVIESPAASAAGTVVVSAAASSTSGFSTVGPLVARAAVQCNVLGLSRAQVAAYDPFTSTDPEVQRLLEHLDTLGMDLASEITAHLHREFTLTTAASATSYALPADYVEMVPGSLWDRTNTFRLVGPVTPQREQAIRAWNAALVLGLDHRIQGNRLTFPVAPSDGLTIAGEYVSRNWIETAAGAGSDHVIAATDYVLFDPTLVVLGLRFRWLASKGLPEATIALAEYEKRLEWAKATVGDAPVLNLGGGSTGFRFLDTDNLPDTLVGF
jgi:hypothetical protein